MTFTLVNEECTASTVTSRGKVCFGSKCRQIKAHSYCFCGKIVFLIEAVGYWLVFWSRLAEVVLCFRPNTLFIQDQTNTELLFRLHSGHIFSSVLIIYVVI